MHMVLRSRRTVGEVSEEESTTEEKTTSSRRSTRLSRRTTYEESDESDSEVMENRPAAQTEPEPEPEPEEERAAGDTAITGLKDCSIVLCPLQEGGENKEDMNRRSGKPASRIPTFHKRPPGAGQSSEPPIPKKDTPVHASAEASKLKPLDVREKPLAPAPVKTPKPTSEEPQPLTVVDSVTAAVQSSLPGAPKVLGLASSLQSPLLTASPRPAIRPGHGLEPYLPEQVMSRTPLIEADFTPDDHISNLSEEEFLSLKSAEVIPERFDAEVRSGLSLTPSGDAKTSESGDSVRTSDVNQVDAIMDEEAPWETESMNVSEVKETGSASGSEFEEEEKDEKSECHDLEEENDGTEEQEAQPQAGSEAPEQRDDLDEPAPPEAAEAPAEVKATRSTEASRSSCLTYLLLLPTTLLLLCGIGHHAWHYGLPTSVDQLTAQMELHFLDGLGLVSEPCSADCRVQLVESVPVGLYPSSPSSRLSIADSWLHLLKKANSSVDVAAYYFTLRDSDSLVAPPADTQGRQVFEHLKQLESKGVGLQIIVNRPQQSNQDTADLAATGAEVRELDLMSTTGGIVHTKLWVVDQRHMYLGSANMDWRSLSQVKEVGLSVEDCSCLAQDAFRIFGVYWMVAKNGSLPPYWPARLSALSSAQNPLHLKFNGVPARVYLSSAPAQISARGRTDDLSAILSVINDAQKFVYISVMDYLPLSQFTEPLRFWPTIDTALRAAACTRGVEVRLVVSCWGHSPGAMFTFLQSLLVLNRPPLSCNVDVKIFRVPSTEEQKKIPFARVNHAKYMVTDRAVYLGTSNWSENYFTKTAGVGLVVNQTGSEVGGGQQTLQSQVEELFLRDWSSPYVSALSVDSVDVCPRL